MSQDLCSTKLILIRRFGQDFSGCSSSLSHQTHPHHTHTHSHHPHHCRDNQWSGRGLSIQCTLTWNEIALWSYTCSHSLFTPPTHTHMYTHHLTHTHTHAHSLPHTHTHIQGCLTAIPLAFILPTASYLKLSKRRWCSRSKIVALVVMVIGITVMIIGTVQAIIEVCVCVCVCVWGTFLFNPMLTVQVSLWTRAPREAQLYVLLERLELVWRLIYL